MIDFDAIKDPTQVRYARLAESCILQFLKKNTDYGSSFQIPVAGVPASMCNWVRAMDKVKRINNLIGGRTALVASETVIDTLKDLEVYCKLIILCLEDEAKQFEVATS